MQSRYYNAEIGRFVNGDEVGIIVSDESIFEYCYNSPVGFYDCSGYKAGNLFNSRDEAVIDFAYWYYNISLYIKMELSSLIYTIKKRGRTKYSYTKYIVGDAHHCYPLRSKKDIPKKGVLAGIIHTHIYGMDFSSKDIETTEKLFIPVYVITPNKSVKLYHDTRGNGFVNELIKSNIKLSSLSKFKEMTLKTKYRNKWKEHIKRRCGEGCSTLKWPAW